MRRTITWLLALLIVSMLVGTAFAECAAMAMPCCRQHQSTTCQEICAAPAANLGNTVLPAGEGLATIATISPVFSPLNSAPSPIPFLPAPSTENLLERIHLLQI